MGKNVMKLGMLTSILSLLFALGFIIAAVLDALNLLGVKGGPLSLFCLMFPSFFLPFSFIMLVACLYSIAENGSKIFALIGLSLSIIYATLIVIVYYTQLTLIIPNQLNGTIQNVTPFLFIPSNSFLFGLDVLGYGIMNLATLFLAFTFNNTKIEKSIKIFLFINGILFPSNFLTAVFPQALYFDFPWIITFPLSMILLTIYFRKKIRKD
jgi:hypothetical protein